MYRNGVLKTFPYVHNLCSVTQFREPIDITANPALISFIACLS
jgi:hypothetical protein